MLIISIKRQHTSPWKNGVPLHLLNMRSHTGSMCYVVVTNVQVFSCPDRNKISMTQTHSLQYVFIFTESYNAVLCMAEVQCLLCSKVATTTTNGKLYTQIELVLIESSIKRLITISKFQL